LTLLDKSNATTRFKLSKFEAFRVGDKPTLAQVLRNREKRVALQTDLCQKYSESVVVTFKCNIPGEIKNNEVISYIFTEGKNAIHKCLVDNQWEIGFEKEINDLTGPELFLVINNVGALEVKEKMIAIETTDTLARLFDFDVSYANENTIVNVSRESLGYETRKCLICDCDAKQCARSRTHSLQQLHDRIILYILERGAHFYESEN